MSQKKINKKRKGGNFINEKSNEIKYKSGDLIGEEIIKNQTEIPKNLIEFPDVTSIEQNLKERI